MKVRVPGGETVYAIPEYEPARLAPQDQLRRVMGEWVAEVRALRQPRRRAHAARLRARRGSALDRSGMPGCSARSPATTRCCASPTRTSAGTTLAAPRSRDLAGLAVSDRRRCTDPLARAVRGRTGRRADGVHGEPAVRPPLWPRRHRRLARPRARPGARRADHRRRARRDPRRARRVSRPSWPPARSSSSPSDEDIHTAVERRVTELAGPAGGQAAHRPQPQRPGAPRTCGCGASASCATSPSASSRCRRCCSVAPTRPATPTCPATRTCSAPSRCCSPTTCWPTAGRSARDVDRLLDAIERLDVSPLGAGALAGSSLPLDPAFTAARARLRAPRSRTRSTPSATATSSPRRCSSSRWSAIAPVAHRRGVGAVDQRGVRLRPPRRRLRHRLVDAAAEEEPRHRRAGARQGGSADRQPHRLPRHAEGPAARYNRDLQEDKEPLFDAVDQVRLGARRDHRA